MNHTVRYWQSLTTPEIRDAVAADPVAILPLAAVEQHGPHLPLETDRIIGDGLIGEAFRQLPGTFPAWVLPAITVGASSEHGAFPGTLSLDAETLIQVICAHGRAVAASGVRRLVLSNSHGGNRAAMDVAALRLRQECGLLVVKASYFRFPQPEPSALDAHELRHGLHGGTLETAMMLHLAPDAVRREHLFHAVSLGEALERDCRYLGPEGAGAFAWLAEDLNLAGVTGDASRADADTGARLVAHFGGVLATLIQETRGFPLDALGGETLR
ncbi:creatininase family protein [Aquisalimonas asiatica]|uniref:Creatinine amidohydrolase n=1 Tax=Aquisalimonas asiatica TaxID=406100 RepID=A0A1H8TK99_9GAMM|nr:creatininase family protein [Aquisalimonas asiatica]SEO91003.1 creatinine amidohydrolase [Aquisalimonas asiatica]